MHHARRHHRQARRPAVDVRHDPALRASDQERDDTVTLLREHGATGRIDVDELEQRIGAAYAARTRGDLDAILRDLPGALPAPPPPRHVVPHGAGHGWSGFVQVNVLLIAIWAVTGAGYFWPAWVMLWWGLALVMKSAPGLLRLR
jgi:hypothetical protein